MPKEHPTTAIFSLVKVISQVDFLLVFPWKATTYLTSITSYQVAVNPNIVYLLGYSYTLSMIWSIHIRVDELAFLKYNKIDMKLHVALLSKLDVATLTPCK